MTLDLFSKKKNFKRSKIKNLEFIKRFTCKICPYREQHTYKPKGSENPEIYFLGGDPTSIRRNLFFSKVVEKKIKHRKASCLQCKPIDVKNEELGLKCCKDFIVEDIEQTKPKLIVGIGSAPLKWLITNKLTAKYGNTGIRNWRGRFMPVKIGSHVCWYLPILNPQEFDQDKKNEHLLYSIKFDLKKAISFVKKDKTPMFFDQYYNGISTVLDPDLKLLKKKLKTLLQEEYIGVDVETTAISPYKKNGELWTVSVGTEENTVSFPAFKDFWKDKYDEFLGLLKWFLLKSQTKIVHNLQYEALWFHYLFGQKILRKTKWTDTMVMAYVLDERSGEREHKSNDSVAAAMLGLGVQTLINLGFDVKALSDIDFKNMKRIPLEETLLYNGLDVKWMCALFRILQEKLQEDPELLPTVKRLIKAQLTLSITKADGVDIDLKEVNAIKKKLTSEIAPLEKKMFSSREARIFKKRYGKKIDLNSNKDLVILFRDVLKYKAVKTTKKGEYGVDKESLKAFAKKGSSLAKHLQKYRDKSKLLTTYINPIEELLDSDGLIRGDFSCTFTSTGRLASANPNLQNFPKHTGKYVRRIVKAPEGYYIVSIDYGQIEARCIAMLSEDPSFIEAIQNGYDIHKAWALEIIELQPSVVNIENMNELDDSIVSKFRQKVKNKMVFPLFFNATKYGVARDLRLTDKVRDIVHDRFWKKFSQAKKWQRDNEKSMYKNGYVSTLTGRRRHIPLISTEYCNSPVQGSASDIVVDAMNRLSHLGYKLNKPQYQARINVHDDLTFFVPEETLEEDVHFLCKEMCRPCFDFIQKTKVPLSVEVSIGKNWADMQDIHVFSTQDFKYN